MLTAQTLEWSIDREFVAGPVRTPTRTVGG